MRSGRAVWRLVLVAVVAVWFGLIAATANHAQDAVGDCACTFKDHKTHGNAVIAATVKPKGHFPTMEELSGSVVWLCKHSGSNATPDFVVWQNELRSRVPLKVWFKKADWPFTNTWTDTIVVPYRETTVPYTVKSTIKTDGTPLVIFYECNICPKEPMVPRAVKMLMAPDNAGSALPQPGPAVVVDD